MGLWRLKGTDIEVDIVGRRGDAAWCRYADGTERDVFIQGLEAIPASRRSDPETCTHVYEQRLGGGRCTLCGVWEIPTRFGYEASACGGHVFEQRGCHSAGCKVVCVLCGIPEIFAAIHQETARRADVDTAHDEALAEDAARTQAAKPTAAEVAFIVDNAIYCDARMLDAEALRVTIASTFIDGSLGKTSRETIDIVVRDQIACLAADYDCITRRVYREALAARARPALFTRAEARRRNARPSDRWRAR